MVDYEIGDYIQESFFEAGDNWDEYQSIMEEWDEPTPQEKDSAYNIFTLEQAINTIQEIGEAQEKMKVSTAQAVKAIEDFLKVYTNN